MIAALASVARGAFSMMLLAALMSWYGILYDPSVDGAKREPSLMPLEAKPMASSDQLSSVLNAGIQVYR